MIRDPAEYKNANTSLTNRKEWVTSKQETSYPKIINLGVKFNEDEPNLRTK
jgi:hypothetical protein